MNKYFKNISDKTKFRNWLLRQYFNKEKNFNDPWYHESVNFDNVLEYISDSKNKFPLTPIQITDMWACIKKFKKRVKSKKKEIDTICQSIKQKEKTNPVEHTLKNISESFGDITITMVNRLGFSAMEKFKVLTFETHFNDMSEDELLLFNQSIDKFRKTAVEKYILILRDSNGDLNKFFNFLNKKQIMTLKEINLIQPKEFDMILQLYTMKDQDIKNFLLKDIELDNNIVKSYQAMISKEAFPTKRRGRPKKVL